MQRSLRTIYTSAASMFLTAALGCAHSSKEQEAIVLPEKDSSPAVNTQSQTSAPTPWVMTFEDVESTTGMPGTACKVSAILPMPVGYKQYTTKVFLPYADPDVSRSLAGLSLVAWLKINSTGGNDFPSAAEIERFQKEIDAINDSMAPRWVMSFSNVSKDGKNDVIWCFITPQDKASYGTFSAEARALPGTDPVLIKYAAAIRALKKIRTASADTPKPRKEDIARFEQQLEALREDVKNGQNPLAPEPN